MALRGKDPLEWSEVAHAHAGDVVPWDLDGPRSWVVG